MQQRPSSGRRCRSFSRDFTEPFRPSKLNRVCRRIRFNRLWRSAFGIVGLLTYCIAPAQPVANRSDLTELPIETLLQLEVTTVSRKSEKLSESPAAVSVITQDDIRRSGVTSIEEALRLAPGLEVARVDASQWAISARGFNDVFAN